MNRRQFLKAIGAGAAALALPGVSFCADRTAKNRKPNFVFIFADDLGWGDLGCYGNRQIKTPNLDRLARQGTLFTQFYVNASVCSPSRTAIMTGQFPARHSVHGHFASHGQNKKRAMGDWLDPKVDTLTKLLKQAGYATGHFGKWHLGSGDSAPTPGDYGIDDHRTETSNGPGFDEQREPYFRAKSSELIADETIRFIEANRDKPFYVNLWSLVPHATLHPTDEQMEPYKRYAPRGVPYDGAKKIYYASVTDLDTQIGRLVARIDELGLAEDTIIAFSSDNGPEDFDDGNAVHSGIGSSGPFRGRKRSIYEGGVRMPFIVRWKGKIPAGRVDKTTVACGVDWLPTVCSLAKVQLDKGSKLDGEDMTQALIGKGKVRSKPLMWEWRFRVFGHVMHKPPMLAIRDGKWKLLINPDRSRIELYDIPNDPREMTNLAGHNPEIVKKLSKKVLAWQKTLPPGPVETTAGKNEYLWPGGNR